MKAKYKITHEFSSATHDFVYRVYEKAFIGWDWINSFIQEKDAIEFVKKMKDKPKEKLYTESGDEIV